MTSKNKVLFFHHTSLIGGASKSGALILKTLNKLKISTTLVYRSSENGKFLDFLKKNNIRVDKLIDLGNAPHPFYHFNGEYHKIISLKFIKSVLMILLNLKSIKKIINSEHHGILILNSVTIFWILFFTKKLNSTKICWVRETLPKNGSGLRNFIIKKTISKFCDKVVFISNYDFKSFNINDDKKRLIYNPEINIKHQFKSSKPTEKCTFLFLGGINKLKGTQFILKSFENALLINPNLKLIIGGILNFQGKSAYSKKCFKIIKNLNFLYPKSVQLIENMSNVNYLFRICDYTVFCPDKIHQSRIIFESAFFLKPIIIPDYPNLSEYLKYKAVIGYKKNDSNSLSNLILFLSEGKNKINKKDIDFFKKEMIKKHSFESFKDALIKLINE